MWDLRPRRASHRLVTMFFAARAIRRSSTNLQSGGMPLFEPHLEEIIQGARQSGRLAFGSTEEAIDRGQAIFICVGTPPLKNGDADLSAIEAVARAIAKRSSGYRLVIEKSTVPVQTGAQLRKHLSVHSTNRLDYDVASNPEFLREGSAVADFLASRPDRGRNGLAARHRPACARSTGRLSSRPLLARFTPIVRTATLLASWQPTPIPPN